MTHSTEALAQIRRPRLLIRAARHGVSDYDRQRMLPQLLGDHISHDSRTVLSALLKREADIEFDRKADAATYSIPRHIEVLIALMGEMRFLAGSGRTT